MSDLEKHDLEGLKGPGVEKVSSISAEDAAAAEILRARQLQGSNKILRGMKQGEEWLDAKMGIESQGIDRVLEENKEPPSTLNVSILPTAVNHHF
jgi:hypothetical protein